MSKRKIGQVAVRAKELIIILTRAKALYAELDEITEFLVKTGARVEDYGITMVDNFEEKNTAWKSTAMRRFELKLLAEAQKRKTYKGDDIFKIR